MRRVLNAIHEAAHLGAEVVAKAAPMDQGGIKLSTHAEIQNGVSRIVSDAPHAVIMESGSRPHTPPLKPLIAWVNRHKKTLSGTKKTIRVRRKNGAFARARRQFKKLLRSLGLKNRSPAKAKRKPSPELTDKQIEQIARAIQFKIARDGTKPTLYTKRQLPRLRRILGVLIKKRIKDV